MVELMTMPKRKSDDAPDPAPKKRPKKFAVELDDDIVRKVRVVAAALDMSVPDYVNNRLRPIIEEELPRVLNALNLSLPNHRK